MHLKTLGAREHNKDKWTVEFHEEFDREFISLSENVQDALLSLLIKLRAIGPSLGRPAVDTLKGSKFLNMKELRLNCEDGAWRFAFAFDPRRRAIILVGGNKSGVSQSRFYNSLIRSADERYGEHLRLLKGAENKK